MGSKRLQRILNHAQPQLGEETVTAVRDAALDLHETLHGRAPRFKQPINRDNFKYATAALATYRALTTTGALEQEKALEVMRDSLPRAVRGELEDSWAKRVSLSWLGRSRLMASMSAKAFAALDEPQGWKATLPETDAHWAFDVHQCGLVLYLREQQAPELCPVFCECDVAVAQLMKGLRFERSGTLADGASICDFRYFRM
jgi:hypothetical protein